MKNGDRRKTASIGGSCYLIPDFWPNYDGLVLLISAYAQLGQCLGRGPAERLC